MLCLPREYNNPFRISQFFFQIKAMIFLKQTLPLTNSCLLPSGARSLPGTACYVSDWGRLDSFTGPRPSFLFKGRPRFLSFPGDFWPWNILEIYDGIIHESALCIGLAEGGVGPCQLTVDLLRVRSVVPTWDCRVRRECSLIGWKAWLLQEENSSNEKDTSTNSHSNFFQYQGHFLELQATTKKIDKSNIIN